MARRASRPCPGNRGSALADAALSPGGEGKRPRPVGAGAGRGQGLCPAPGAGSGATGARRTAAEELSGGAAPLSAGGWPFAEARPVPLADEGPGENRAGPGLPGGQRESTCPDYSACAPDPQLAGGNPALSAGGWPGAPGACGPWAETLRAAPGRCVHSSLSAAAGLEGDPAPAGLPDADFRRGAGTAPQRHGEILRGQPGGGEMRACDWPVRHAHLQPGRGNLERGQYFGLSFSGRLGELFPGVVLGLWQRHCGQAGAPGRVPAPGRG